MQPRPPNLLASLLMLPLLLAIGLAITMTANAAEPDDALAVESEQLADNTLLDQAQVTLEELQGEGGYADDGLEGSGSNAATEGQQVERLSPFEVEQLERSLMLITIAIDELPERLNYGPRISPPMSFDDESPLRYRLNRWHPARLYRWLRYNGPRLKRMLTRYLC